jgi:hypothetical protein
MSEKSIQRKGCEEKIVRAVALRTSGFICMPPSPKRPTKMRVRIVGIFGAIALIWLLLVSVLHISHTSLADGNHFVFTRKGTGCDISKIIHQTWKTEKVHARFREHIRSWIQRNPGWEYKFWTNDDCRNLIETKYPKYLAMYDSYPQNIQRADAIRYFILDAYGGVYADLDFEALKPFDGLIRGHSLVIGQEPYAHSHVLYDIERMVSDLTLPTPHARTTYYLLICAVNSRSATPSWHPVQHILSGA